FKLRQGLIAGVDPLEAKRDERTVRAAAAVKSKTFKECADAYVAAHEAGWRNGKSGAQWRQSLRDHVFPKLGTLPVTDIDTAAVLSALQPFWNEKPETASRVRGRIESVLDWARARGLRDGENPARWRGHLENLLPARRKVRRVEHLAALPYSDIPSFMTDLRQREGIPARALEFAILTAARAGAAFGAAWDEIDLGRRVWTIPGARMKGGKQHRVPLCGRVVEILESLPRENGFVFPGASRATLSPHAALRVLERMGHKATV